MKVIWRIILLLIIVLIIFYLMDDRIKENEPLESPVKSGTAIPVPGKGDGQIDTAKGKAGCRIVPFGREKFRLAS